MKFMQAMVAAMFFMVGAWAPQASAEGLTLLDDDTTLSDAYGARGGHWQPGQVLVVFWLPDVPDFVYAVTNIRNNVTPGKLGVWVNTCETGLGLRCRIHNIVWLDNPRTYEWDVP